MTTKRKCFSNGVNLVDVAKKMEELHCGYYNNRIYYGFHLSNLYRIDKFFLCDYTYTDLKISFVTDLTVDEQILFVLFVATIIGHNT